MPIPFGRYQLIRKIASGGMGQVLLAKKGEDDFEKLVVLKRILPHLVEDEEFFNMFRDEAKITMRLDHPNIARINEFGAEEGIHFIEMEYVAGDDLRRIEKRASQVGAGIPVGVVLRIVADAAAGLDFAHKANDSKGVPLNLVHRDVSPQNILVGFDGSVKLIDFGVAKAVGRAQNTATGILKGKFPYMSPEQAHGDALDPRSDVFALGIILWEQMTGRRLFKADNDIATQRLVVECQVPLPSTIEKTSPADFDPIVMKALQKSPFDRYADAGEFRMAIEEYALSHSIPSSSAHLSSFMKGLYSERIAREADPKFLEEDTGFTELDAGGLGRKGGSNSSSMGFGSSPRKPRDTQTLNRPNKGAPKAIVFGLGFAALAAIAGVALWPKQVELPAPVPLSVVAPPAQPVTVEPKVDPVPPLALRIESEPSGANIELGGTPVGKTPFEANIERVKLPLPLRVFADGYEPEQRAVTAEQGPVMVVVLKRKVTIKPSNPLIKKER